MADVLCGAWRQTPPELDFSEAELDAVTPRLLGSGSAGLGWRRISATVLQACPAAIELQQAYRLQSLYAGLHEADIEQIIELLRAAGVDPLLIKGRAAAQFYAERGLRPYGDIDLCFETGQYAQALPVLESPEGRTINVDPHDGLDRFYGLSLEELLSRSQMMKVGKIEVRVPCFEDHLRILCIHFLKHGAWRPLNLCDVAAGLEAQPSSVDWDRCLGNDKRRARWVACTIGLAHQLLGARLDGVPAEARADRLPRWLVPAVLKQWEKPYPEWNETPERLSTHLRKPSRLKTELVKRWPNPIKATMYFSAPFNDFPRLPFQLCSVVSQGARFLARLPKAMG
ncbi:MAG: nucleotidyltransferase family protein [Gammaproteobacteria bacterium]